VSGPLTAARAALRAVLVAIGLVVAVLVSAVVPAGAQDPATSTSTTGVPAPNIVPEPNSGAEPTEAGDRGGGLQLLVLGLVVVAIGGGAAYVARDAHRARNPRS
jgi:hypothetical protein